MRRPTSKSSGNDDLDRAVRGLNEATADLKRTTAETERVARWTKLRWERLRLPELVEQTMPIPERPASNGFPASGHKFIASKGLLFIAGRHIGRIDAIDRRKGRVIVTVALNDPNLAWAEGHGAIAVQ